MWHCYVYNPTLDTIKHKMNTMIKLNNKNPGRLTIIQYNDNTFDMESGVDLLKITDVPGKYLTRFEGYKQFAQEGDKILYKGPYGYKDLAVIHLNR
jgi:hypothetical protein